MFSVTIEYAFDVSALSAEQKNQFRQMLIDSMHLQGGDEVQWLSMHSRSAVALVTTPHPGTVHYLYHAYVEQAVEPFATHVRVTPETVGGATLEPKDV